MVIFAHGRICTYSQIRWHLNTLLPGTEKRLLGNCSDRTHSPFWDAPVQPGQYCSLPRWHAWECYCCLSLSGHQSHRRTECNLENQNKSFYYFTAQALARSQPPGTCNSDTDYSLLNSDLLKQFNSALQWPTLRSATWLTSQQARHHDH